LETEQSRTEENTSSSSSSCNTTESLVLFSGVSMTPSNSS
jgi:hypothetical protein